MPTEVIVFNGQSIATLKELTGNNLRAVFVGMNPAPRSVQNGHYYQGAHGRIFWKRLIDHLILRLPIETGTEDCAAFNQGFGFLDLIRRPTASIKELRKEERRAAVSNLVERLQALGKKPKIVFTYKEPWKLAEPTLTQNGFTVLRMPGPYTKREIAHEMMGDIRRALLTKGKGLRHYLDMVPDVPADPGDELPDGWKPQ